MKDKILAHNKKDPEVRLAKVLYHHLHGDRMPIEDVKKLAKAEIETSFDELLPSVYYISYDCKDLCRFFRVQMDGFNLHIEDDEEKAFFSVVSADERTCCSDFRIKDYGTLWYVYKDNDNS